MAPVIDGAGDARAFLIAAESSSMLYLRVSSPVGVTEAEFPTSGGSAAIAQFRQACKK